MSNLIWHNPDGLKIRRIKGGNPTISIELCDFEYRISEDEFSNAVEALGWTRSEPPIGKPELWVHTNHGRTTMYIVRSMTRQQYVDRNGPPGVPDNTLPDKVLELTDPAGGRTYGGAKYLLNDTRYRKITPEELSLIKKVLE